MECSAGCKHIVVGRAVLVAGLGRRHVERNFDMSASSLEFRRANAWRGAWQVSRAVRSVWMRYLHHRQRQRDLAQLAAMNDFELKDVGISRDQVRAALWEGTDLRCVRR